MRKKNIRSIRIRIHRTQISVSMHHQKVMHAYNQMKCVLNGQRAQMEMDAFDTCNTYLARRKKCVWYRILSQAHTPMDTWAHISFESRICTKGKGIEKQKSDDRRPPSLSSHTHTSHTSPFISIVSDRFIDERCVYTKKGTEYEIWFQFTYPLAEESSESKKILNDHNKNVRTTCRDDRYDARVYVTRTMEFDSCVCVCVG